MRALRILLLLIFLIPVLLIGGLLAALFFALSTTPLLSDNNATTGEASINRTLGQLAEQSDGGLLTLKDQQLANLLRKQFSRTGVKPVLQLNFSSGTAMADASLMLPVDIQRRYVNVQTVFSETSAPEHIKIDQLTIGGLDIPPAAIEWARPYLLTLCKRDSRCELGLETYRNVESIRVKDGALQIQYSLGAETLEQLSSRGIQVDDLDLEPYFDTLNELAAANASKAIDLHTALQTVLSLAKERSDEFSPVRENAAALMALAVQNANPRARDVLFRANDVSRKLAYLRVKVHTRNDLAHHFINSAALFLIGGSEFSDSIGVYKEYFDAMVGKHFDFSDIAGDRAGTMFARNATASEQKARDLQARMLTEQNSAGYLPSKEFIDQLQKQSQKNATGKITAIFPEIDKELASLPLLN